jgi:hypothetical protein
LSAHASILLGLFSPVHLTARQRCSPQARCIRVGRKVSNNRAGSTTDASDRNRCACTAGVNSHCTSSPRHVMSFAAAVVQHCRSSNVLPNTAVQLD